MSQWARHDLTVNKTTTTLFWRGHTQVSLTVDTKCVNEPNAVKCHSVGVSRVNVDCVIIAFITCGILFNDISDHLPIFALCEYNIKEIL